VVIDLRFFRGTWEVEGIATRKQQRDGEVE
jgi:hypothetical protein